MRVRKNKWFNGSLRYRLCDDEQFNQAQKSCLVCCHSYNRLKEILTELKQNVSVYYLRGYFSCMSTPPTYLAKYNINDDESVYIQDRNDYKKYTKIWPECQKKSA